MNNSDIRQNDTADLNNNNEATPAKKLKQDRRFIVIYLLSLITCGIYPIVDYSRISKEINIIAGDRDGKKTMHYCLMYFVFAPLTLGIAAAVWFHRLSARIGDELIRRRIYYRFGARDYWLWAILGSFIIVGPIVYLCKLYKAMNFLAEDYNNKGI